MKPSKEARLRRQRSASPAQGERARWLASLTRRREEPYAAESVISIGVLVVAPAVLLVTFAIAGIHAGGLIGDCFDNCPPAQTADVYALFGWVAVLAIPMLPLVGVRALFGDHAIARTVLTVWALALMTGAVFTALYLISVPELLSFAVVALFPGLAIATVAVLAWLKWWTTRVSRPIA